MNCLRIITFYGGGFTVSHCTAFGFSGMTHTLRISPMNPFVLFLIFFYTHIKILTFFSVFDVVPDLIREGGTIPIARTFQDVTGKSIIMMPIGGFDDGLHSQNEKISRSVIPFILWLVFTANTLSVHYPCWGFAHMMHASQKHLHPWI